MYSYSLYRRGAKVAEYMLSPSNLQGIYTYYMLIGAYYRRGGNDLSSVQLVRTDLDGTNILLQADQASLGYYTAHAYPSQFRRVGQCPYIWNIRLDVHCSIRSSTQISKQVGAKAIMLTLERRDQILIDLITTNVDEFIHGLLLIDMLEETNLKLYLCDVDTNGFPISKTVLTRLTGFSWNELPPEMQEYIQRYAPRSFVNVDKNNYDLCKPLLVDFGTTYDALNKEAIEMVLSGYKVLSVPQLQFVCKAIQKMGAKCYDIRDFSLYSMQGDYLVTDLHNTQVMKIYTDTVLKHSSKAINVALNSLLWDSMHNPTYLSYLLANYDFSFLNLKDFLIKGFKDAFARQQPKKRSESYLILLDKIGTPLTSRELNMMLEYLHIELLPELFKRNLGNVQLSIASVTRMITQGGKNDEYFKICNQVLSLVISKKMIDVFASGLIYEVLGFVNDTNWELIPLILKHNINPSKLTKRISYIIDIWNSQSIKLSNACKLKVLESLVLALDPYDTTDELEKQIASLAKDHSDTPEYIRIMQRIADNFAFQVKY